MTAPELPPVVVVDDDPVSARLVTRFLERLRLANPTLTAGSVEAAVDLLCNLPAPPVLLLLDVNLGDGSGFDVLRRVEPSVLGRAVLVVLTGSNELEDVDEAYALGAQSYLVKPVAFEGLGDIIHRVGLPWALLDPGEDAAP
ncbi:MAG: response regulator [Actinomycetota bacterium]|nr:response regulator [Actinomycetota bacterium]